jgi:Tol biopolymer transport system component
MIRVSPTTQAWSPTPSPDGKLIGFALYEDGTTQPWKTGVMRAADGTPLKIFDIARYGRVMRWTADGKSMILIRAEATDLWEWPIDGSPLRRLTNFESGMISNFAISPNQKRFVLARGNYSAEAVLLENF